MVGCGGAKVVGSLAIIFLHVAVSVGAQVLACLAPLRPFPLGVLRQFGGYRRVCVRRGQRRF